MCRHNPRLHGEAFTQDSHEGQEDFIKVARAYFIHREAVTAKDFCTNTAALEKVKDFKEYLEIEDKQ